MKTSTKILRTTALAISLTMASNQTIIASQQQAPDTEISRAVALDLATLLDNLAKRTTQQTTSNLNGNDATKTLTSVSSDLAAARAALCYRYHQC